MTRTAARISGDDDLNPNAAVCPLGVAINAIGGRWKLHIIRSLLLSGPQRYNALVKAIDGISAKELTRNLRELESANLVDRFGKDSSVEYGLTALGQALRPVFERLGIFGTQLMESRRGDGGS